MDYKQALYTIPCASLSYDGWIRVGMAAKDASAAGENVDVEDYEAWSATDVDRYVKGEPTEKWGGFKQDRERKVTKNTLRYMARRYGFSPLDNIKEDPDRDLVRYLRAVFRPDDLISYNVNAQERKEHWVPQGRGVTRIKASELIKRIEAGGIDGALGDYNHEAGGWIRINPVDGEGIKDENITDYRNVLIECDTLPQDEQLELIEKLKIPARAIVDSGGKSIHAVMRVDAEDAEEYGSRVNFIFKTLKEYGLDIDTANNNPARLSRMPGLDRGERTQRLIDTNTGLDSFKAWESYIKSADLEIVNFSDIIDDPPPLDPELIEGILRKGHKMIITGPSKAGKTQLLVELFIALAEGREWLGFKCKKSKVLYINLEIVPPSFYRRVIDSYGALGYTPTLTDNLRIINLRGRAQPMDILADRIIARAKKEEFDVIIIDPVYKVQDGDENAAGDITRFTNQLDKLATGLEASVIYSHHHSKGAQAGKRSIDRGSGSSAFARDADAILDFLELESPKQIPAYRVESTLREFESKPPINVYFNFPIHIVDTTGELKGAKPKTSFSKNHETVDYATDFNEVFETLTENGSWVDKDEFMKFFPNITTLNSLRVQLSNYNTDEDSKYIFSIKGNKIYRYVK